MDAFYKLHKCWPTRRSGPIDGVPGESWDSVYHTLLGGRRGLPRGVPRSLAKLLNKYRREKGL